METLENSLRLLDENTKSLNEKAKFLLREFPNKILKFDKILEQALNQPLSVLEVHHHRNEQGNNIPGSGPRQPGQLQSREESPRFGGKNSLVERAIREVKSYIQQLNSDVNLLKMCIASLPPKAADKSEAKTIKVTLEGNIHETCMKIIAKFYKNRAEVVLIVTGLQARSAMTNLEEFWNQVITMDENMFLIMRSALVDIRNQYSVIYGLLAKNFDEIISEAGQSDHE